MYQNIILNYRNSRNNIGAPEGFSHREYRDMGFTPQEFANCLPLAVEGDIQEDCDNRGSYSVYQKDYQVVINTRRGKDRVLGSLVLPVLHVSISFRGQTAAQYLQFRNRFDRHFLRMGG